MKDSSHLSYGAASLMCSTFKRNLFKFYSVYIYIYIYIFFFFNCFPLMYFTIQRAIFLLPDLVLHLTFLCSPIFVFINFKFYKIILHS